MKNLDLKKLAKVTAQSAKLDPEVAQFVLNNLTRRQLLVYLRYLRSYVEKNTVRIIAEKSLSEAQKKEFVKKFAGKTVIFEQENIGDGIRVQISDTIFDLSMSGFIDTTIERLKQDYA